MAVNVPLNRATNPADHSGPVSHGTSAPSCLGAVLQSRISITTLVVDEIAAAIRNGQSAIVVGPPGIGKTECCKAAIRILQDDFDCIHMRQPPQEKEVPQLLEWVAGLDRDTIVFVDEAVHGRDKRDCEAINSLLADGEDWVSANHLLFILALEPNSYEMIRSHGSFGGLSPYAEIQPKGFGLQEAETYMKAMLGNKLPQNVRLMVQQVFEEWGQDSWVNPMYLFGLYTHLRTSPKSDDMVTGVAQCLSGRFVKRLPADEQTMWTISADLRALGQTCPEDALLYACREQSLADPERTLESMTRNGLFSVEHHPVYVRVYTIHDMHQDLTTKLSSEDHSRRQHVLSLLMERPQILAHEIKETVARGEKVSARLLHRFISACCVLLVTTKRMPPICQLIGDAAGRLPPLGQPRRPDAEQQLRKAVDDLYDTLLRALCSGQSIADMAQTCRALEDLAAFYQYLTSQGVPLQRLSSNTAHEVSQFLIRWLSQDEVACSENRDTEYLWRVARRFGRESARLSEYLASNLSSETDPFSVAVYWRTAAHDHLRAGARASAVRCFEMAASGFLGLRGATILAAECYRQAALLGDSQTNPGTQRFLKYLQLSVAGQSAFFLPAKRQEIVELLGGLSKERLVTEWATVCQDLCNSQTMLKTVESHDVHTLLQNLTEQAAADEAASVDGADVVIVADRPDDFVVDYLCAFLSTKCRHRTHWVTPDQILQHCGNPPVGGLAQSPKAYIVLGGLKAIGIAQLVQWLLPDAKRIGRTLAPQENHTGFLWMRGGGADRPAVIWAAGTGLEGTFEAAWHLVNEESSLLAQPERIQSVDAQEVPHIVDDTSSEERARTLLAARHNRRSASGATPEPDQLYRDFTDLMAGGKRRDALCRRCVSQGLCQLGGRDQGPIMRSSVMRSLRDEIEQIGGTLHSALIQGESGSGKEPVAWALHRKSGLETMLTANCAGLTETLIHSELFGHVTGAFTGAVADRDGLFAAADGGTLFLDEIADMPKSVQAQLLRVLETGEIKPLGSDKSRHVRVRVIAATHRDLTQLRNTGEFRNDLYYRISAIRLAVPPLRDRPEDMPCLVARFLSNCSRSDGRQLELTADAFAALLAYDWPGNIRELRRTLETAASRAGASGMIETRHLRLGNENFIDHTMTEPSGANEWAHELADEFASHGPRERHEANLAYFHDCLSKMRTEDKKRQLAMLLTEIATVYPPFVEQDTPRTLPKGYAVAGDGRYLPEYLAARLGCSTRVVRSVLSLCGLRYS